MKISRYKKLAALLGGLALFYAPAMAAGKSGGAVVPKKVISEKKACACSQTKIPVRVVVLTAFEIGEDQGDKAGEFQAWANILPEKIDFPAAPRNLRFDPKTGVLAINTGMGTGQAATSVMALGHDDRFDLSHAYWLVAAIAGVNPNASSIGSAAWIGNVVDSDFGYSIDPREMPSDWSTGSIPWDKKRPYETPRPDNSHNLFALNKGLQNWAYQQTAQITLPDNPTLQKIRSGYPAYKTALRPPEIVKGDEATGQAFWHGVLSNSHIEKWVSYWTDGSGHFVMTGMEDSGIARAIAVLSKEGRADYNRVMMLRTGANYTFQPSGSNAAASLAHEGSELSGMQSALDAAFTVGDKVVSEISSHWDRYRDHIPAS
ncbi:purine nucleoside permease [Zymomonas sp.]|uniref:purine nucleoside permease n=1 Tax=Zymomonas sp. TaxID=2068624 RepID=UPI0025EA4631|nr:purine nucleoside permease [Zymomonas sp.]MCA1955928.1 purine nucleoside permease [Zymomonas sp.]